MRQLEQELEDELRLDRLVQQEEEMESLTIGPAPISKNTNPEVRWLQRALNVVSAFGIPEDGIFSTATKRAIQQFQSENRFRTTGKLGPKGRALLIELSGMLPPTAIRGAEGEAQGKSGGSTDRCPIDSLTVIRGFAQYSSDVQLLPANQQAKLAALATEVVSSYSGAPRVTPITHVVLVGHSDEDPVRQRADAGFLQYLSQKRAVAVFENVFCKVTATNRPKATEIRWSVVGRGPRGLAVPAAPTEAEHKCNRRVEVRLLRDAQPVPRLDDRQPAEFTADHKTFLKFYHIALQGTSCFFNEADTTEKQARDIAERVPKFLSERSQKNRAIAPGCEDTQDFLAYFKDALQGTASKWPTADEAIQKAAEAAEATNFGLLSELRKLEWKSASLPQPMGPDCEIVHGKVPGPANHALCQTHEHVIDASSQTVIAHDLDEYKSIFRK